MDVWGALLAYIDSFIDVDQTIFTLSAEHVALSDQGFTVFWNCESFADFLLFELMHMFCVLFIAPFAEGEVITSGTVEMELT